MSAPFVHLHVHTQFSMLDGAIRIDDLISRSLEYEMGAVAVTDHGAMYGALQFYEKARKAGIKPLVGCEFYVAEKSRLIHDKTAGHNFHLVLLAMNKEGYQNLMKLTSLAQTEGFYYRPRIDMELLNRHNEGLIALTACLHGEIPWRITNNDPGGARKKAKEMLGLFGDRLYLEIQENGIAKQQIANRGLIELGKELDIKIVATNDCHYLTQKESYAHEVLLAIQTGHVMTDPKRFRFSTDELYFKSAPEMAAQFDYCPEALSNTLEIADRCNLELSFGENHFPIFPVPENETLETIFEKACWQGLDERLVHLRELQEVSKELEKVYKDRLTMEIGIIKTMGFAGYFLIVADFIIWSKEQQIPVGPGRGSGAGSLAAYAMAITDIDPIPYGLIFERFLNVERMSMPDFDVDFCKDRRDEVIDYVRKKYGGDEHVAQIVAYGSMKARAVLRDVGRTLEIPLPVVDKIAKLVPEELQITLKKAIAKEPRLKDAMASSDNIKELLNVAQTLEGLCRHKSTHAAGVVISPKPMVEYLPVCVGPKKEILTQYDMKYTEKTGLIKFDFLGLKTLTVIDRALKLIRHNTGSEVILAKIPLDDPKTYDLLCRGDGLGVFQLESDGMRELLVKMKPEQFSDLIALVALYRPGPLESGMVDTFINTKHGRQVVEYPHPSIENVLKETYGVIVYQEQVMKIASILAGYSLGDADILRRAMGKKIHAVMEEERGKFMAGCAKNKIPKDKAKYIFDLMAKFAGYGFNKSHSAAYALIAYQTAWLKAHYPAQFLAALLSCDVDNTDKVVKYISECKQMGLSVLPPDINESFNDFTVIENRIRFGLAAVKNVGGAALESIIAERKNGGAYKSLSDLCNRIDSSKVNRKVIESLIKAGGFDSLGFHRAQYIDVLDLAIEQAKAVQRDRLSGQMSLFGLVKKTEAEKEDNQNIVMPDIAQWPQLQKLRFEKETVGFFLTGHPLESAAADIKRIADYTIEQLTDLPDKQPVRFGGLVKHAKPHKTRKGDSMAFTVFEDMSASVEVVVFPSTYEQCSHLLESENPLMVLGAIQQGERGAKIIAESIDTLADGLLKYTEKTKICLQAEKTSRQHLEQLKELFYEFHGKVPVTLTLHFSGRGQVDIEILKDLKINPCTDFFTAAANLCGEDTISVHARKSVIQKRGKNGFGNHKKNKETEH